MSASLAEKIRRSRQGEVDINGRTFLFHRPTDLQMAGLHAEFGGSYSKPEIARRYVCGWKGMTEADLFTGGSEATPAPFEKELFNEWLADARDYWDPLYKAILGAYADYSTDRGEQVKN
jgi:hypothetical protein